MKSKPNSRVIAALMKITLDETQAAKDRIEAARLLLDYAGYKDRPHEG